MKKFIILSNTNAVTYKDVFSLIKNNELWLGVSSFNRGMYFQVPDNYEYTKTYKFDRERNGVKVMRVSSICWFTNLDHAKRNRPLVLTKSYTPEAYPRYDNYNAIEISKTMNIPYDYQGVMGVPVTFLDKWNPEQFEIVGITENADYLNPLYIENCKKYHRPYINGKCLYARILIRHRK